MLKLFSVAAGKVDINTGIISGVSIITAGVEAIGHGIYTDQTTLAQVKNCADAMAGGVQVKMDHWGGFEGIVGVLKNFRVDDNDKSAQLRADLHLLKSHPAFNQICEMAETMPESFGLSISFSGKPQTIDDMEFARCTELYSVDLVTQPAANPNGLFSATDDGDCPYCGDDDHCDCENFQHTMLNGVCTFCGYGSSPFSGKEPYGDVAYADPGFQKDGKKRYPVDTKEHAKAAWNYINKNKNAGEYTSSELAHIKSKIKEACKKFGVEISEGMSSQVDSNKLSNADKTAKNNFMNPLKEISDILTARKTFAKIDEIINPALSKAGVLQLSVNNSPVALDECPLEARLISFVGLLTQPEGKQREAELVAGNAIIAAEKDAAVRNLASATASVSGLQVEKSNLQSKVTSLESAVATMTAEKAQMKVQLDAAITETGRVNGINLAVNSEISRRALSIGCLVDLRDPKTKELLPSTATATEKELAADMIPAGDKLNAIFGAVNMAASRIGVDLKDKPAENPAGHAQTASREVLVGRYQKLLSEGKTQEAAKFYKANLAK